MKQSDLLLTIGRNFKEVRRASLIIAKEKGVIQESEEIMHRISREFDKAEIVDRVLQNYKKNGESVKLPKKLKRELAKEFNFSEKEIERIIYGA